jgi:formylglycine-generating enzyme required for sulfatase activity
MSTLHLAAFSLDPVGPATDDDWWVRRVNRGGFWGSSDATAQVAFRSSDRSSHRSFFSAIGFRLARTIT